MNPKGGNIRVAGKTGQGKTTAISALWEIIKTVGMPINERAKKANIRLELGDLKTEVIAERRFTPKTKTISIKTPDGKKISVEEFKSWFCSLGINPHKLLEKGPTERINTLLETVDFPAGFDYMVVNETMGTLSEEIKQLGKDIIRREKVNGLEPEEVEIQDITELISERDDILKHNDLVQEQVRNLKQADLKIDRIQTEIKHMEDKIAELQTTKEQGLTYIEELRKWFATNQEKETIDIDIKIKTTDDTNKKATLHEKWKLEEEEIEQLRKDKAGKTRTSKKLHNDKQEALDGAKWPLEGLGIVDGVVVYHNVPIEQLGTSEQFLVCGTLAAKQISESPLRVVRLDGVESMDQADFEKLEEVFNHHGVQVLSSRVTRTGEVEEGEIVIEEGEIKC